MHSQSALGRITAADPIGKKQAVQVRVDYDGHHGYSFDFGSGISTPDGTVVCLGPPGTSIATNRYVLNFIAVHGDNLKDASFVNPANPADFDFIAGVIADPGDPCCLTVDPTEFAAPVVGPRQTIVLVDLKKNSGSELGYRFTVWVTHYDDSVVAVPCDPRIINR